VREGQERKRLIKLARQRFTDEEVRAMVQSTPDSHPTCCVVQEFGIELLRMWCGPDGMYEVSIDDDVRYFAIIQLLEGRGLVFDTDAEALEYGRQHGLLEWPQEAEPAAAE